MDWTTIINQFIGTLPATIAAIVAAWLAIRNTVNITKIEVSTNSMKDALVAATEAAALLKGAAIERAAEKVRKADVIISDKLKESAQ